MDLASARHELYGSAPASFVAERDRLAKALQAEGKKQDAAALRKLRKPAATVWALNQVARHAPALIEAVLDAGARLVAVHQTVARGRAGDDFRETSTDYRRAIAAVVADAQQRLASAGHAVDPAATRRLERTLEALPFASATQQAATRAGELDDELERADVFDSAQLEAAPAATAARPVRAPRTEERRAAALDAARAAERTAKAAARAEQETQSARVRLEAALRAVQDAEDAHAAARQRAEQARADVAAREATLAEARRTAHDAADASARASKAAAENDES